MQKVLTKMLKEHEIEYGEKRKLHLYVATWNMGGERPKADFEISRWLSGSETPPYAFC